MEFTEAKDTKKIVIGAVLKNIAPDFLPTNENLEFILSKLKFAPIEKGGFFVRPTDIADKIGILLAQDSILKAYRLDEDGNKKVSRIFYSPHKIVVSSFESFKENKPSGEFIQAVNKVLLMTIQKSDLDLIYKEIPSFNLIGRILAEQSYINAMARLKEMQTFKGKELVASFYRDKKFLIPLLDKSEIASYLGLSRNKYSDYLTEIMKAESKTK